MLYYGVWSTFFSQPLNMRFFCGIFPFIRMFAMIFPRPYNFSCIIIPSPPEVLVCHPKLAVTRPSVGPGCHRGWKIQSAATLGFFLLLRRLLQSVTNTFFLTKYKKQIIFSFQKSPITKY